jgi:hypothetical protein
LTTVNAALSPQELDFLLRADLPLFGHRNWVAVVDSAYPAQSRTGIRTAVVNADQAAVLKVVVGNIAASSHVRPIIYTDAELRFVKEPDAPGVDVYRSDLSTILGETAVFSLPHEEIISKLDEAAKTFNILIIKTDMTIPYTSVFFQLDCKYWSDDAEKRLREAIAAQS